MDIVIVVVRERVRSVTSLNTLLESPNPSIYSVRLEILFFTTVLSLLFQSLPTVMGAKRLVEQEGLAWRVVASKRYDGRDIIINIAASTASGSFANISCNFG